MKNLEFPYNPRNIPTVRQRDSDIESIAIDLTNRITYELGREDISKSALESLRILQHRINSVMETKRQ